jgi:uncharacterized protein (DUF1810 family)
MSDSHNLERFVEAQNTVYDQVRSELQQGVKRGHWMWFIFPQIAGLGSSSMAARFAISSLEEAKAYLAHPVLGARLIECTELVNRIARRNIQRIFAYPDDLKFRSSMTLFAKATAQNQVFTEALDKYFDGEWDDRTIELLG